MHSGVHRSETWKAIVLVWFAIQLGYLDVPSQVALTAVNGFCSNSVCSNSVDTQEFVCKPLDYVCVHLLINLLPSAGVIFFSVA